MENTPSQPANANLGPERLDAAQQQQMRDQITEERLHRRRNAQGEPSRVMQTPETQPREIPQTNAPRAEGDTSSSQGSSTQNQGSANAESKKLSKRDLMKNYSKQYVRKRLAGAAKNVLGTEHQGRLLLALLALAVLKDSADIMSLSLLSWIDWIIDALLWVLYVLAFGNTPKNIQFELRVLASFAALVEFVPFLDLFTTWTFLVIYSIFRAEMASSKAFQVTVAAFRLKDQKKPGGASAQTPPQQRAA